MQRYFDKSRPTSPESPLMNSFHDANTTIDELTSALANFLRVPSPEPPILLSCCCGGEECQNSKAWMELKSRLESRLILSAEVGQALLQKHEAYVRSHKRGRSPVENDGNRTEDEGEDPALEITELLREKSLLEKRLNQVLVNNEVTEVSNKTILHELQEARSTISRLTNQHARSLGWETRLASLVQEKEDMQQERDGEANRAKLAESRFALMKDRTAKLQSEVRRLQDALADRRSHHLESSEQILRHARTRLEALHSSQLGKTALVEQTELMNVLETLVSDNEILKRDNAQLQIMLTDSREEIHGLQEEVEEHRVKPPSRSGAGTPLLRQHLYAASVPSSLGKDSSIHLFDSRSASVERRFRRPFEPLTPEAGRRPLSPTDSLAPSEIRWSSFGQPQPRYPPSHISIDIDDTFLSHSDESLSPDKPKGHKTLLLLTRSRAIQTDEWLGNTSTLPPQFHMPISSPQDYRSESSSFSDTTSSNLSAILERINTLFHRMAQADALTLTNRLKRQHLKGADIRHLSRTTVKNIISELTCLHTQYRHLLEDDSLVTSCVRKDFRLLFKLFKDIFHELAELRVVLNDVILDPSVASRVSELALHPSEAEAEGRGREHEGPFNGSVTAGWMAPISKLFSPSTRLAERSGASHSTSNRIPRFVPKLGPALSASATTVNVEFSGTAVGRSTTSIVAQTNKNTTEAPQTSISHSTSSAVMNIFAGAPRSSSPDPWVLVPKGPRRFASFIKPTKAYGTAFRRPTNIGNIGAQALSRDIDAILDLPSPTHRKEDSDILGPLVDRPLRRRGLSDSSIHSTFSSQATDEVRPSIIVNTPATTDDSGISAWPDPQSVLQTFSRTVQNFRMTASGALSLTGPDADASSTHNQSQQRPQASQADHTVKINIGNHRSHSPAGLRTLFPTLSSWAVTGNLLDPPANGNGILGGSVRDESFVPRTRRSGEAHERDFF